MAMDDRPPYDSHGTACDVLIVLCIVVLIILAIYFGFTLLESVNEMRVPASPTP